MRKVGRTEDIPEEALQSLMAAQVPDCAMQDEQFEAEFADEIVAAKRKACSLEGYRFIAEQLAEMEGKAVTQLDMAMLIGMARFALDSERELKLDELRKAADSEPYAQASGTLNETMELSETAVRDLRDG